MELKIPSEELVEEYYENFKNSERYYLADKAIEKLIEKFPKNNTLEHILLKTIVINDLYSTQIYGTVEMAKHIKSLNIDKGLEIKSPDIVTKIATGKIAGKRKYFYSFASKYCNWHDRENFPIYDKYVERLIWEYKKQYSFVSFRRRDLRDYPKYKIAIKKFREYYKLTKFNYKELDKFLWLYGKKLCNKRL